MKTNSMKGDRKIYGPPTLTTYSAAKLIELIGPANAVYGGIGPTP